MSDSGQLSYYFDFYEWRDTGRVAYIDAQGRVQVFQLASGPTMTFLISGPTGCGRSSLENLILFELAQRSGEPLVVSQRLSLSAQDNFTRGTMLVQDLEDAVRQRSQAVADTILSTFSRWQQLTPPGVQPDITNLLARIRRNIEQGLPGAPIVVSFDALDHSIGHDTGLEALEMVQGFADVAILSVTIPDHASFVRSRFSSRQRPVAWINAPRIQESAFRQYLERRMGAERAAGSTPPHATYPLSDEAISTLFAPAEGSGPVELSIRLAIQKLAGALAYKERAMATSPTMSPQLDAEDVRRSFARQ
ncbi:MAG TPA: hypothetical protein VF535_12315 [Allosphingosinicella sp.]